MWKYLNKGISTPIAIGIILILVIIVGGFTLWQYGEIDKEESNIPEAQLPEKEEVKDETDGWQTYRNEEYGFEVKYPKEWVCETSTIGDTVISSNFTPTRIFFRIFNESTTSLKKFAELDESIYLNSFLESIEISESELNGITTVKKTAFHKTAKENVKEKVVVYYLENGERKIALYWRDGNAEWLGLVDEYEKDREIRNQMLSTFKFIEEEIKTNEIKEDLNNDGQLELIITSANSEKAKGYITISKINEKGDYEKLMEFEFEGGTRGIPSVKEFRDINNDNQKEIFLNLGAGGASTNGEGILDCDFQNRKLNWVRIQDENGKIQNAIFYVGAAVMHSDDYIIEDLDNDGNKEIIKLRGLGLQTKPEEIKPWERLREHPAGEGVWWIEEARAYEWNGSLFSYNEDLSKKYWNQ